MSWEQAELPCKFSHCRQPSLHKEGWSHPEGQETLLVLCKNCMHFSSSDTFAFFIKSAGSESARARRPESRVSC